MMGIVIVDYGMANLRSVQKALERVGHAAEITSDPARAAEAERLVLPGVGAFRDAIARLRQTGLDEAVTGHFRAGKPFLGICLGMQLLFERSLEDGVHEGLGVFAGEVRHLPVVPGLKVPHMGWNRLRVKQDVPMLRGFPSEPYMYFVHSYCAVPADPSLTAAEADYPEPFCAAIRRGNVFATQFHPEKSQRVGLHLLREFASWDGRG
ncbi:MAG: imidazole glycerol phosphate synthase subunit HisH [Gemmataceae bacterium]|nr:imidazole glycerol phosphate synthase subunit HisH [Gemmataceae bacterium]